MVVHITTVAFVGIEARLVDVQVQVANGLPFFTIVGLPDKAVAESRERVRAALGAIGLALPPKRITVNLAPADLPKEGSHYDLPVAMGVLVAMGAVGSDLTDGYLVLGETWARRRPSGRARRSACRHAGHGGRPRPDLSRSLRRGGGLGWGAGY